LNDPARKLPPPTETKAREQAEEKRRELAAVDSALSSAARAVAEAGRQTAPQLHEDLRARSAAAEREVEEHLQAAAEAGQLAGRLSSEASWVADLARAEDPRHVRSYFERGQSQLGQCVDVALREVAELKRKRAETEALALRRAEREAAKQAPAAVARP
jgi:hypothetical protein